MTSDKRIMTSTSDTGMHSDACGLNRYAASYMLASWLWFIYIAVHGSRYRLGFGFQTNSYIILAEDCMDSYLDPYPDSDPQSLLKRIFGMDICNRIRIPSPCLVNKPSREAVTKECFRHMTFSINF